MNTYTVDCLEVRTEANFWQAYLDTVKPDGVDYFGRNLHAFRDALSGGPGWPGVCLLRFINTKALIPIQNGEFYNLLISIASESKIIRISFN